MKNILIHTFIALIATTFLISCDNSTNNDTSNSTPKGETVRWKMASTFPGNLSDLHPLAVVEKLLISFAGANCSGLKICTR